MRTECWLEDAALILHVVDCSSPTAREQVWSVMDIVAEVHRESDSHSTPQQILVLNKVDAAAGSVSLEHESWVDIHDTVKPLTTVAMIATLARIMIMLMKI